MVLDSTEFFLGLDVSLFILWMDSLQDRSSAGIGPNVMDIWRRAGMPEGLRRPVMITVEEGIGSPQVNLTDLFSITKSWLFSIFLFLRIVFRTYGHSGIRKYTRRFYSDI